MELNNFLVNRFNTRKLFMLYCGRNIKIIIFILKNKWFQLRRRSFTRDKIMISIIHGKQNFTLYKSSMGGK